MTQQREKGLIAWFARNPVAANLLMVFIIVGGILSALSIRKQMFPQFENNWLSIQAVYPGAAPQEVEEGITIKVEESLQGLEGIKRLITYSNRGYSQSWIEVEESYDPQEVLDEVKMQVDAISSFPAEMERPNIRRQKFTQEVMILALYGDMSNYQLKELGNKLHDEMLSLPLVNLVEFNSGLDYEISIEVSPDKLREYGLTFRDIATAVRNFSANMSAGQIRSDNGYISMRVEKQAYRGNEFEKLPLITLEDGAQVFLGDVATIQDGFEEGLQYSKYNGKNSLMFEVAASKDQDITRVAAVMDDYLKRKETELPAGVKLTPMVDLTYYLEGRLDMMIENMIWGGVLVMLMLAMFLRIRLAFWVMMGLPVSFLGAFLMMPVGLDITINLASLFAFILVLGIVVDDAIVVGESAHAEIEKHGQSLDNVVRGVKRVAVPATFGVLTTVAAFLPQTLASGPGAAFSKAIGGVIILCLLFSLVESKLILPAHLAAMKNRPVNPRNPLHRLRSRFDAGLKYVIESLYRPAVTWCIHYRYTVIVGFLGILIVSAGLFAGGLIKFIANPKIPHDFPGINIEMNLASSESATLATARKIEQVVLDVEKQIEQQYGQPMIRDISVNMQGRTNARLMMVLVEPHLRPMDTFALSALWRENMPPLPGLKSMTIDDSIMNGGGRDDGDISFRLEGRDNEQLKEVAAKLKDKLATMAGVGDINDSMQSATEEVQLDLKPIAYSLGLTLADVASQVNFSFYGLEAQRILRDGEELKVMIRYPIEQRNSISEINDVRIITPAGAEVPLAEVAEVTLVDGVNRIRRENAKRTVNVWAAVDPNQAEPFTIAREIRDEYLPALLKNYPGVQSKVAGRVQEEMESVAEQIRDLVLSLMIIFALLAIPLRSYTQPLLIMSVIPFGVVGAVYGHVFMGMTMSSLSFFGIIAVAGVVVNDSLVMVDFVNKARAQGIAIKDAVVEAGCKRFRAILLTSITTFIGLIPIITETSLQAQIVIPMAVSLAFGVLFATVITLVLIPCQYVALEDAKRLMRKWFSRPEPGTEVSDKPAAQHN
ncbi:efflux RND transporter permease subunit [Pseudoalteromonas ruthenica]|uniref:efflux RND transporter permease subunit n=1 Tax=Pseudoalteromonas ruthenica TaxID=151081 RepID=UPI00241D9011|nr:efflux RND transporter permease subunit [Pseudoalteromonas ruthenica]